MIEYFQEDGLGDLYIANGIGAMLRWDGFAAAFDEAGMTPPATALTLGGGGGPGAIVGTYFAYSRFVDAKGNVSDLSPISAEYEAVGTTGTITGATDASPISITSTAHGLVTGATVKIEGVGGNTGANGTFVITVIDANTFTLDDSHGGGGYDGGGTWTSGVLQINFTNVPVPTESKVVARQILRNTDGQASTFYVDLEVGVAGTSFSSTKSDTLLAAGEAVPLLDSENRPFANLHAKPLSYYPFLAYHGDRMFALGSVEYTRGHVKVANGSATVYGVGTEWKSTMASRFLYVSGATEIYEIASIDETLQTLTLTDAYTSPTDKFAFYAIKPPAAFERNVAFTEPGLAQSWPVINGISVQETGDRFTGAAVQNSFVYVLESRHMHKVTFSVSPTIDGGVFMAASRGCVNNRCWIAADDALYMLDELGIFSFSQRQVEPMSQSVQSFFRPQSFGRTGEFKINWKRKAHFHAVLDRQQEVIRWFVCLDGHRYPHDAICLQYRQGKIWIERFPFAICGAAAGDMGGLPQVYYGAASAKILAAWQGWLDLASPDDGTIRNTATAAALFTLTDSAAIFGNVANAPLSIVAGKGKGQTRKIVENTTTELTIQDPWNVLPDVTSVYQIGGVHWEYRTGWMRFGKAEESAPRTLEFQWEPLFTDGVADLRFAFDTPGNFEKQKQNRSAKDGDGVAAIKDDPTLIVDLQHPPGISRITLPGHKEQHIRGKRYVQFELEGYTNEEPVIIYQWIFEGVIADSAPPAAQ